jgi:hypothetical protein
MERNNRTIETAIEDIEIQLGDDIEMGIDTWSRVDVEVPTICWKK